MGQGEILVQISSEPRNFRVVRVTAEAAALACGLNLDEAGQVKLAVHEALANVVNHGYMGRTDQPIWVKFCLQENGQRPSLTIVIEDQSETVDVAQIKSRPLHQIRPGGLGVHIIRTTMDQVEYSRRPNGPGMCLRMCKFAKESCPPNEE